MDSWLLSLQCFDLPDTSSQLPLILSLITRPHFSMYCTPIPLIPAHKPFGFNGRSQSYCTPVGLLFYFSPNQLSLSQSRFILLSRPFDSFSHFHFFHHILFCVWKFFEKKNTFFWKFDRYLLWILSPIRKAFYILPRITVIPPKRTLIFYKKPSQRLHSLCHLNPLKHPPISSFLPFFAPLIDFLLRLRWIP